MKKVILSVAAFIFSLKLMAQAPEKMSYQAVVRNSSNGLVISAPVGMRISILQGSAAGASVYTETQTVNSNANGLVSLEIGSGTVVSGNFSTIDWSADTYFIQTETDPTGGTSYTVTGTSQLMSVPYALHAKSAESVINNDDADADPNNEIELPSGGNNGQVLNTDGSGNYTWVDQTLNTLPDGTVAGQTAYWNGTAWVVDNALTNNGTNVGVGTTSPVGNLDVAGVGTTQSSLVLRNGNDISTNAATQVAFGYANSDQYKHYISTRHNGGATYNNSIDFYTSDGTTNGGQTSAVLNLSLNGGNVGVNTNFPSEKLDVVGNVKFSGALMPNNTAGTTGQVLTSTGAGAAPTWTTPAASSNIYSADGTLAGNRVVTQGANTLGFTASAVNAFSVDGTTLSVDASNNRVGIGTAAPGRTLDVNGVTRSTTLSGATLANGQFQSRAGGTAQGQRAVYSFYPTFEATGDNQPRRAADILGGYNGGAWGGEYLAFHVGGGNDTEPLTTERMRISGGNVGIGTTTPNGKLAVGSAIGAPLVFQTVATISENNAEVIGLQGSAVGANINFYKNGSTARQAIIGSSTNGLGADIGFRTTSSTGVADQQRMVIKADGNVGIGTLTPQRSLHINAVMRLEPTSAPTTPAKGDIYMDATTNKLMVFDGSVWQACW